MTADTNLPNSDVVTADVVRQGWQDANALMAEQNLGSLPGVVIANDKRVENTQLGVTHVQAIVKQTP